MIIILLLLLSVLLLSFSLGCLFPQGFGLQCDGCCRGLRWGLVAGLRVVLVTRGSSALGCDCSPWAPGHPTFCDLGVNGRIHHNGTDRHMCRPMSIKGAQSRYFELF